MDKKSYSSAAAGPRRLDGDRAVVRGSSVMHGTDKGVSTDGSSGAATGKPRFAKAAKKSRDLGKLSRKSHRDGVSAPVNHAIGKAVLHHFKPVAKAVQAVVRAKALATVAVSDNKDGTQKFEWNDEVESLTSQLSLMRSAARAAIGGNKIKIKLYSSSTLVSGAGAALANWYGIIPSSSIEWASLITLYDEARVNSVEIKHVGGVSVAGATSASAACVPYAVAYDPTYNSAPSSVEDVQESQYSQLKLFNATIGFSQSAVSSDFHKLHVKIPHDGAVMNEDMKTKPNFPGQWMSCLDTVDSVGYIRYYVPALGGAYVTALRIHLVLDMEFRIRT